MVSWYFLGNMCLFSFLFYYEIVNNFRFRLWFFLVLFFLVLRVVVVVISKYIVNEWKLDN